MEATPEIPKVNAYTTLLQLLVYFDPKFHSELNYLLKPLCWQVIAENNIH